MSVYNGSFNLLYVFFKNRIDTVRLKINDYLTYLLSRYSKKRVSSKILGTQPEVHLYVELILNDNFVVISSCSCMEPSYDAEISVVKVYEHKENAYVFNLILLLELFTEKC